MRKTWFCTATLVAAASITAWTDDVAPALRITSPRPDAILSGATRLEATIVPEAALSRVQEVRFFVDGRLVCTVQQLPLRCTWDAGTLLRAHHVRVVAMLANGGRLVDNVHTKDLGYAERVRSDAVLVPVIVRRGGEFVRGLKPRDFEVSEDGVPQPIASMAAEDAPLDLVVAVDISGSMEQVLPEVRSAVKRLLAKLRPGDAATVVGFNDTAFVVAERETDPQVRSDAVDLLSAWGGTALYDATVRALDLVGRDWGRKGVVIFSDGDDRDSLLQRETAMTRVQASEAVVYTIGYGSGATVPELRRSLESYARATGGHAFFPRNVQELDEVFDSVVAELANQYVLSYSPLNSTDGDRWRSIKVTVRKGKYAIKARAGYRLLGPQRAGR
ncbi:MAG TPA: VWA domain-containing protein [Vicinamibacterales bacterium]|nr:VWA domain-containing protein [Vicinamibacterales bacterium]